MSFFILIFIYTIACYGISNMFVYGSGPFRCFEHIRNFADNISPHFGLLFHCMMCFPANLGLVLSLINWFFIPVPITPFNFLFYGVEFNIWVFIICLIGDIGYTSGFVWLINTIEEWFERSHQENNIAEDENIIEVEDITQNNNERN